MFTCKQAHDKAHICLSNISICNMNEIFEKQIMFWI